MKFNANLKLTPTEVTEISTILGCAEADLNARLNACFAASIDEYLTMFRGQKVFKRGSDMREYRLLLLIEKAFDGVIPDERTVSRLFQTTLPESRALIRAVVSKYQYQLKPYVDRTVQVALGLANKNNNEENATVVINNQNVVDELNKALAVIDGNLSPVVKKKGSVSTYEITLSAYSRLCAEFSVKPKP